MKCPELLKVIWTWLYNHHYPITSVLSTIAILTTIIGIFVIIYQFDQSHVYKRYDNYLYFNKIYDEWYDDMPVDISKNEQTSFNDLDGAGKAWVRRYFNLYAQEFYFYSKALIPEEMWQGLIHGCKDEELRAAFRNLKKYRALLQGYCYWKREDGAFGFPEKFISMLDQELQACKINLPNSNNCN